MSLCSRRTGEKIEGENEKREGEAKGTAKKEKWREGTAVECLTGKEVINN